MRFMQLKKIAILYATASIVSLTYIPTVQAQDVLSIYLPKIHQNTLNTVKKLDQLPVFLENIGKFIAAWMNPDDSEPTTTMQTNFNELGNLFKETMEAQRKIQASLNSSLLNNGGDNVLKANKGESSSSGLATTRPALNYANDLVYSTLLNMPYYPKDPRNKGKDNQVDPALNYIKNASGLNIYHPTPAANWQGSEESIIRYQSLFNVVTAVESFNSYVLSSQYVEKNQFNEMQTKLINQASDPAKWFAKVSSENIGFVLRQLLFYQSQIFILLTESIKLQKQMVTAQVMTNTVLIATNQSNENLMSSHAKGEQPKL